MTTTRVPVPTTNLKERIAALEQRNASKAPSASRPASPPPLPGVVPSSSATATAPGFRDKIAKFERKGGVPVPRGRFGLGAPPPNTHGPSRQGELYGNRIPAPARTVSVGSSIYPGTGSAAVSRAASPTFSNVGAGDRRSFSLSSVGDFESEMGGPDYTPIASPTFTFPPDSPETVLSPSASELGLGGTPEVSPALNLNGEAANFVKPVVKARGTSFQKALEIARSAEQAKLAGGLASPESAGVTPTGTEGNDVQSPAGGEEAGEVQLEMESQLRVQQEQSSTTELGLGQHTEVQAAPSAGSASPSPSPSPSPALLAPSPSSAAVSPSTSIPSPALTDDTVLSPTIVSPTTVVSPSVVSPSSSVISPLSPQEQAPAQGVPMVIAPTIEVTPLTIRKRGLSLSQPSAELATPSAEVPPLPATQTQTKETKLQEGEKTTSTLSKEDEARGTASLSSPGSELPSPSSLQSSPGVPPPRYSSLHHTFFMAKDEEPTVAAINRTGSTSPESQRVRPLPQVPPPTATVGASPEGAAAARDADDDIAPPSIVVSDTTASVRTPSRKNSSNLTINSSALKNASTSTLVVTDDATTSNNNNRVSANSITEVLTTYFKGPATPPMSPAAKLAYDASPEASPGLVRRQTEPANLSAYANANATRPPVPAAINPPDPASFLSPPQTGLAPSSGGSSLGSFSSLNSSAGRPYSMSLLEGSPTTQVHTALRMTPATSRGVPVFLPPVSASGMPGTGRVRKSDWGHFPPTPTGVAGGEGVGEEGEQGQEGEMGDADETEFGSVVVLPQQQQHTKAARSMVDFSELGMTRAATVSGATRTQFTAVVHGKVREATVPLPSSSSSSSATTGSSSLGSSSRKTTGVPQTPQQKEGRRNKRDTILETPLSPGHGELAALLQEAMLLEDTLSRGTLPAEEADSSVLSSSQHSQGERKKLETIRESEGQSKSKDEKDKEQKEKEKEKEERKRIAAAQAQLQAKRDEPTSGKLKHTFLIPLSKARSQHRKEVSAPASAGGQTPTSAYPPVSAKGETFPSSASVSGSGSTTSLHRLEEPQPPVPPRPKSAGVPENGHGRTQSQSQSTKSRPVTPENQAVTPTPGMGTRQPQPQTPSKSPGSRFGSFSRRIGGAISGHGHNGGRPSTIHGASASAHTHTHAHAHAHGHGHGGRYSNSTSSEISSIDSQPVATPPEGMLEFGVVPLRAQHTGTSVRSAVPSVSVSEYGRSATGNGMGNGNGSQTSFPSLSPKKSASSLGRATSFAEKMWSRARTKSSGSTLSTASEVTIDDSAPRLFALGPPPALELSSIPGMEKELPRVVNPPKRSTSLKRHNNDLPPIPTEPLPPLPVITSSAFDASKPPSTPPKPTAKTPTTSKSTSQAPQLPQLPDVSISDISNDSLLTPGFTADSASRSSWTSMSSAGSLGSLPSPLFDKDLFDAFPSVPGTMPVPQPGDVFGGGIVGGRRETAIPMGAAAAAVAGHAAGGNLKGPMPFDAALLSSAIHLQGRRSGETAR